MSALRLKFIKFILRFKHYKYKKDYNMIEIKPDLTQEQLNIQREISKEFSISPLTSEILIKRGIDTVEKCKKFLNCGKQNFLSPYLLKDLDKAEQRIKKAVSENEKILIYGDYDCDGVCSTSILYYTFKELGIEVLTYVPERKNGYGITESSIKDIIPLKPDLIITVDCGISCKNEIEYLKNNNIDVIVTDHHELPEVLPDCITVNCKIKSNYPYDNLCGSGVAYKLAKALIGDKADELLDFVAVATIADSMTLIGENRDLVKEGLKLFKNPRPCFKALCDLSKIKDVTSTTIAYTIAPRINASGRMGKANDALKLLKTTDYITALSLAETVNSYNQLRQSDCEILYEQAKNQLKEQGLERSSIVLQGEGWSGGLTGIVSARLAEEYRRPVILFSLQDGVLKGSARSIEGINVYEVLNNVSEFTCGFGGHNQAAGVSVKQENFENFKTAFEREISKQEKSCFVKKTVVDKLVSEVLSLTDVRDLNKLEPFGVGNKKPLFLCEINNVLVRNLSGNHIAFSGDCCDMVYFNGLKYKQDLSDGLSKKIIFEINVSTFNGKEQFKGFVKGFERCLNGDKQNLFLFRSYIRNLKSGFDKAKKVSKQEMKELVKKSLEIPYGTIFAVNNPENLEFYPELKDLSKEFCRSLDESLLNKVIFGLENAGNYKNVLYLDDGNRYACDNSVVCESIKAYTQKISCERESFIPVFKALKNAGYLSSVDFALKNRDVNAFQAIFCVEVLIELGIVKEKDGYIYIDNGVKADLSKSKILKICETEN